MSIFNPPTVPKHHGTLFHILANFQAESEDLIICSTSARRVVEVSWPISRNRARIFPGGIREFLRSRGLHWPCFCVFLADDNKSVLCRIIEVAEGQFEACCSESISGINCGFFINLNLKYESATRVSDYDGLPTLASMKAPCKETLLATFFLPGLKDDTFGGHFEGYFGEHCTWFPGVEQLSSLPQVKRKASGLLDMNREEFFRAPAPPIPQAPVPHRPQARSYPYNPLAGRTYLWSPSPPPSTNMSTKSTSALGLPTGASFRRPAFPSSTSSTPRSHPSAFGSMAGIRRFSDPNWGRTSASASASGAGSSSGSCSLNVSAFKPTTKERELLGRLEKGEGLVPYERDQVLARCVDCGETFLKSAYDNHKQAQCKIIVLSD
ncbi:hypothetical protein DXG01_002176 [Tephrocybe rancida]|nr:hypothetical protein DXG01_002176 [Tephrocybe rancida]